MAQAGVVHARHYACIKLPGLRLAVQARRCTSFRFVVQALGRVKDLQQKLRYQLGKEPSEALEA